jgi:hypothetical protein
LAQALHDHPALTSCLVRRITSYGTGGPLPSEDAPVLAYFNARFAERGYKLRDLLRAITLSPAFSEVAPEEQPADAAKSASLAGGANAN